MSVEYEEKKIRRTPGQGITIFHQHEYPDVDILAVPGLGTDPVECWTRNTDKKPHSSSATDALEAEGAPPRAPQKNGGFNWLRDPDGLASVFPKSRIMVHHQLAE
ncbi:uncharacterized protein LTR77_004671 [Saxophila tyrrhenica]|uniref:Uncharacterized protein n=1 Tax=Saxophila tyrrhenica TaxID=1690608 RepID=A0AAV9PCV7_9PEZI|nr:hypothetical protein LTR77_004671 [Saxophila tyrrhenica]